MTAGLFWAFVLGMIVGPIVLLGLAPLGRPRPRRPSSSGATSNAKVQARDSALAILSGADGRPSRVHSRRGE